jgi:hypothetical protein
MFVCRHLPSLLSCAGVVKGTKGASQKPTSLTSATRWCNVTRTRQKGAARSKAGHATTVSNFVWAIGAIWREMGMVRLHGGWKMRNNLNKKKCRREYSPDCSRRERTSFQTRYFTARNVRKLNEYTVNSETGFGTWFTKILWVKIRDF